jgi:hypothetical protein
VPDKDWIDWLFAGFLILLAPLFLFPSSRWLWVFMVVPALLAARGFVKGRMVARTPFDGPILLLLFQIFLTCLIVPDIGTSLSKITGALFGILVFYALAALLKTRRRLKMALLAFIGGGALFSVIGFLGMFTMGGKDLRLLTILKDNLPHLNFRLPGAEEGFHTNAVGGSLVLFLPLIYVVFLNSALKKPDRFGLDLIHQKWAVYLFAAFAFLGTFVLVLTQSRGSWAGFLLAVGLIVLPHIPAGVPRRAFGALYFSGVAAAIVFGYLSLAGTYRLPLPTTELSDKFTSRTVLWSRGLEMVAANPWTGIGLNQVRYDPSVGYKTAHLHNHYIHTAAELGVPALCALLAIMIGAGVLCLRTWRGASSRRIGWAALGLGAGLAANAVFGIADSISIGTRPSFIFWVSLALINGLYESARRSERVRV